MSILEIYLLGMLLWPAVTYSILALKGKSSEFTATLWIINAITWPLDAFATCCILVLAFIGLVIALVS